MPADPPVAPKMSARRPPSVATSPILEDIVPKSSCVCVTVPVVW